MGDISEKEDFINTLFSVYENVSVSQLSLKENEKINSFFERFIDNFEISVIEENESGELFKVLSEKPFIKQKDYKSLCSITTEISLFLYFQYPESFLPILFSERFDKLMNLLDVLNIEFPQLPTTIDKRGRLMLYNNLCENIINFAKT